VNFGKVQNLSEWLLMHELHAFFFDLLAEHQKGNF
jgi:hypothetical protein